MPEDLGYGPLLSGEEYERRIVALYSGLPPVPSREQECQVRRQELDLAIDHRLGRDFPQSKREALWAIQERVEKKRGRLILKYVFRKFFFKSLVRDAQGLSGYLVEEYAKVLDQRELDSFFGPEEARNPALPIDLEHFKK
jgi:hypothetical protein